MNRALREDEIAYLKALKAPLDEALLAAALTLLTALIPLATLSAAFHGVGGDRLALGLGALVLALLLAGIVVYSGLAARARACTWRALKRRRAIAEDLGEAQAEITDVTLDEKHVTGPDARGQRHYEITTGRARFEISGLRWLELAPGQVVSLETAPNSGVVLAIDGQRDRLSLKRGEPQVEPMGG